MADEPRRIIDLTETQLVGSGDYLALDSADGGTKKVKASYFSGGSENYMWGGIQGDIADQTDLYEYLEQLPEKANIDGYYEDMSVGSAEQLLSNIFEGDSTPYLYRTSGGSLEIGDRVYEDAIVGASMAWNQLIPDAQAHKSDTPTTSKWITTSQFSLINGHKYMLVRSGTYSASNEAARVVSTESPTIIYDKCLPTNGVYQARIFNCTETRDTYFIQAYVIANEAYDFYLNVHDLTLALGSTIADYVYTLETSEAGSGIAWLKSQGFFTKDYYAYNAGGIQSVKTSAKKVVGFNAYNNTTGKAKLVGGHKYQITGAYTALAYSTGETITPDANGKFTPSADGELTVTGGNGTTTCVHLVWDGERDGEYEPYEEHTYPLDSDLELRGVPKLDSANKLYYDGDTYESDGTVTRNYGIVDLGTLTWAYVEGSNARFTSDTTLPNTKSYAVTDYANAKCSKYEVEREYDVYSHTSDKIVAITSSNKVQIYDSSYTDAATFKTAMSGVYLVYELATPTTESADPYTSPQLVDNWGTEEFVDTRDVPVPVGHESRYLPDLKAKVESAPNNPSTNGKYFLQYQNGEATYVPVPSEVPQTPSEDGTYVLKATVSSGTATLRWVAEE